MRMAKCRRHKLAVLVHDHGCPLHVFVPLHVRPVGLPLVSHQATPQLPRCFLHNLNRDEPVSATVLGHCPVALLTIHLLVGWSVQPTYHVPGRAASSLANLNAAFRELDHHVIRCQVLNPFAAVPIAGDLVDLPTATTTLVRWSQLDGDAIAVCGLVSIAMAELLWRSEDVMRLHACGILETLPTACLRAQPVCVHVPSSRTARAPPPMLRPARAGEWVGGQGPRRAGQKCA
mmetsp:Transcript_96196/g.310328  ORF Transcript_96196/g.310328 Transcript_96196/m.310328 type:complete len:232 (-) Transcript_96196:5-700(-)